MGYGEDPWQRRRLTLFVVQSIAMSAPAELLVGCFRAPATLVESEGSGWMRATSPALAVTQWAEPTVVQPLRSARTQPAPQLRRRRSPTQEPGGC
jgi:hypothetical protein